MSEQMLKKIARSVRLLRGIMERDTSFSLWFIIHDTRNSTSMAILTGRHAL